MFEEPEILEQSDDMTSKLKSGEILTKVKIFVKNIETLEKAISNLNKISDIYSIERTMR